MTDAMRNCGILVVDDESIVRASLTQLLKGLGYLNVLEARSGMECITQLAHQQEKVSVILLDVRMSPFDGEQVMERIVAAHPYIVGIIVITGHMTDELDSRVHSIAAKDALPLECIEKPIKQADLTAHVESMVELVAAKRTRSGQVATTQIERALQKLNERFETLAAHDGSADIKEIKQQLKRLESRRTRRRRRSDVTGEEVRTAFAAVHRRLDALTSWCAGLQPLIESEIRSTRRSVLREIGIEVFKKLVLAAFVIAYVFFGLGELIKTVVP